MKLRTTTPFALLTLGLAACGGAHAPASAPQSAAQGDLAAEAASPPPPAPPAAYPAAGAPSGAGAAEEAEPAADEAPSLATAPAGAPAPAKVSAKMARASAARPAPPTVAEGVTAGVKAGEWDDNANLRDFNRYLARHAGLGFDAVDVAQRRFVVVRDSEGRGVPNCRVSISDERQRSATLTTMASGRAIVFPKAHGMSGSKLLVTARCGGETARASASLEAQDGVIALKLNGKRTLPARRSIDVAFVLDTTGSMSEEIAAVKTTLAKVASTLDTNDLDVRVGLVEYKDRTDDFVTKVYPMSTDVGGFARRVRHLDASGGGDTPEAMNEGFAKALSGLSWNDAAVARVVFVIADAPPHLDYSGDVSYSATMKAAAARGIKVFTIAASGMDDLGQAVFRQMAQFTGGTNLFVLRGGAGPQSTGAGDAKSGCGGTHQNYSSGNLDELITAKIRSEVKDLDRDPTRIAGVGQDENAKPCSERLVLAQ